MPRIRSIPARLALLAAVALTATAAEAAEALKWSPKPGETLKYLLTQVSDIKNSVPGQEVSSKTELNVDLTWKVTAVAADGTVEIAQTVDRVRAKNTAPGVLITYDSTDKKTSEAPMTQMIAKLYEEVLGKPFAIRLSPTGEVLDVKLPPGAAGPPAGTPMADMADAGTFFSAAGVKNLLAQVLPKLPREAVDRGSTWDSELTLPSGPLKLTFKTHYTLAEAAPAATIDATLETAMTAPPEAKITLKITKQSGTGRFAFDPAAGRLDSATIRQSADVTYNDGNADLTQTTESTLTFKRVP